MKTKKLTAILSVMLCSIVLAFAEEPLTLSDVAVLSGKTFNNDAITSGMNSFAENILVSAPQASTQQNIWSDAYIGKLISLPPHLGFGFTLGGTKLDMRGLKSASSELNTFMQSIGSTSLDFGKIPDTFFLPVISIDARLGGIGLPVDIGFSAMMTNPALVDFNYKDPESILKLNSPTNFSFLGYDGSADYLTLQADIRYNLVEDKDLKPDISIGAGYVYTKGELGISSSGSSTSNMDISFSTEVIYIQAEISKNIKVVSLFGGARVLVSKTSSMWTWNINSKYTDGAGVVHEIIDKKQGSVTADSFSDSFQDGIWDFKGFQPQVYAGLSINFNVLQIGLSACCDVRSYIDTKSYSDSLWSGALSFHLQF